MTTESDIQHAIRLALGREPDLVLWRNNVGVAHPAGRPGIPGRPVRYGLCTGSSDLIGILAPSGRFVALEIKTPQGRATTEQLMFLELVRKRGGFATIVRSPEDARAALERARMGATE